MENEHTDFTSMVEAFRWMGSIDETSGESPHHHSRQNEGHHHHMHSSPEGGDSSSSSNVKRRLVLQNIIRNEEPNRSNNREESQIRQKEAGAMVERARARLEAAVASEWYKPTHNLYGSRSAEEGKIEGQKNTQLKEGKEKLKLDQEIFEVGFTEDNTKGLNPSVSHLHSISRTRKMDACVDANIDMEFNHEEGNFSNNKLNDQSASGSGLPRKNWICYHRKRKHNKSQKRQDDCINQELLIRNWSSDGSPILALGSRKMSRRDNIHSPYFISKIDDPASEMVTALDADETSNMEIHQEDFIKDKISGQDASSSGITTKKSICYQRERKHKKSPKELKAYINEELLSKHWSSDDSPTLGLGPMKIRQKGDTFSHYFMSEIDGPSQRNKQQILERGSYYTEFTLYNEKSIVDSSDDISSSIFNSGEKKRRSRRKGASSMAEGKKLVKCSVQSKQRIEKKKGQKNHTERSIDNEVNHDNAQLERISYESTDSDVSQMKKHHRKRSCASLKASLNTKEAHGNVVHNICEHPFCSSARTCSANVAALRKEKRERRTDTESKTAKNDQKTVVSTSDCPSETTSGRKKRSHKQDPDAIGQRIIVNKDWVPPVSAYGLIQEEIYKDPWKVLVACMLLNKTSGVQMRQVIWGFFDLCPTPEAALAIETKKIEETIRSLGLQKKRAQMIQRFSHEYLGKEWTNVTELHGIGKYATDAYAIFCEGRWKEVKPNDHKLNDYWQFLCETDGLGYAFKDERGRNIRVCGLESKYLSFQ